MRRIVLIAGFLALSPVVAWAQTVGPFAPNSKLYSTTAQAVAAGAPAGTVGLDDFLGTKSDYPLAKVGSGGLAPLPAGSPLTNWGLGIASSAPGGVADPNSFYVVNGGVFAYKARSYGTEDRGCAAAFVLNASANDTDGPGGSSLSDNAHCGVLGTLAQVPSRVALDGARDSVALFARNDTLPPLWTDPAGTFDATDYYPSAGYIPSALLVSQLRVGMFIDVGPNSTKWTGTITGWNPAGTSIQVSGWFQLGNQSAGQVPTNGSVTYVSPIDAVESINTTTVFLPGTQVNTAEQIEADSDNDSGVDPGISGTPNIWGFDSASGGTTEGQYAFVARGPWAGAFFAESGSFCGFCFSGGTTGTAFYSNQVGNVLLSSPDVTITGAGNANLPGTVTVGGLTSATSVNGVNINASAAITAVNSVVSGTATAGASTVTGSLTAGGINVVSLSVHGTGAAAYLPTGTAPSGTCPVAGQIEIDPTGTKLYACPSNGGAWKYTALTTN